MKSDEYAGGNPELNASSRYDWWRLSPLLVLAISLFVSYQVFRSAQQDAERQMQSYFDFRVREAVAHIEQRIQAYEQVLRGVAGLFESSMSVERDEFKQYVAALHLADNYPGIQGVGFSLIVPASRKSGHITAIRREGFPEYAIKPEGLRDIYTSIIYLEPFVGRNVRAFGYDMYSEPVRHAAMQKAIDSGAVALSGKVRLVQESGEQEQAGFLMYLPIYRNGVPHDTLAGRRASAAGWVYAPFRMEDFMQGAQGEYASDLDIEIFDGENASTSSLMHDSDGSVLSGASHDAGYQTSLRLQIVDHPWSVHIRSLPAMRARIDAGRPRLFAVAGVIGSLMLSMLVWMLLTGRGRAIKAAQKMNEELIESEARFRLMADSAPVLIWMSGTDKLCTWFNKGWMEFTGRTMAQEIGNGWAEGVHPEDLQRCIDHYVAHFERRAAFRMEYRLKRHDGEYRWIVDSGVPRFDESGEFAGYIGSCFDINDRVESERRLRTLSTAVEQSPISVVITDVDANIQYINPRFTETTGYSQQEAIGQNPRILQSGLTPKETYRELWGTLGRGQVWHGEMVNKRKSGDIYWEEAHISPVTNELGALTHYVAVKIDITQRKQIEEALRESERRYHFLFNSNPMPMWVFEEEGLRFLVVNDRAVEHYGFTREEFSRMTLRDIRPIEDIPELDRVISRSTDGKISGEWRHLKKDGTIIDVAISTAPMKYGPIRARIALIQDITERKRAEETLRESEGRFRFLLENSPIAVRIAERASGRVVFANQRYAELIGRTADQVLGVYPEQYYAHPQEYWEVIGRLGKGERVTNKLVELLVPGRLSVTKWVLASYLQLEYLGAPSILGWFYDISDRKAVEEQVQRLAHYDPLTGLPNRILFSDRLQQALAIAKRDKAQLALMFIDLDKFKPINDTLGHDVGDLLLKEVGLRIRECLRESDTVARIGGDEFVVLLPVLETEQDAWRVAEKIRAALNRPFELSGQSLCISSSTGIAIYPEHGADEKVLIKNADTAMYYAKAGGRDNVKIYHPGMQATGA